MATLSRRLFITCVGALAIGAPIKIALANGESKPAKTRSTIRRFVTSVSLIAANNKPSKTERIEGQGAMFESGNVAIQHSDLPGLMRLFDSVSQAVEDIEARAAERWPGKTFGFGFEWADR